ncbi:serine phosphatase [Geoalkalibacter ferrihydriticus]|uniref:Serine/threonine protein phosphatase n=2 Tax=Geoalkalibacter ferrihydriticus TaxID=392333 RepID=A0A0C2EE52_9BACT|nr:SpoIIE family protein phosphatase [Geoalkalibacter ferrihydriticus]KIH76878.1 serine/threonine protein phosphatase [Geoalkalibacter ferrihydriticus DSM 17813]SDL46505.1 serine phosphatase [Geoalkalibacter ferrihydriticus]
MLRTNSITSRLILVITLCSVGIFAITTGYFYHNSRAALERELESNARNLVLASVNRVDKELTAIGKVAEGVARSLETGNYSDQALNTLLSETMEGNPHIYGIGAMFEPDSVTSGAQPRAPYFYREDGELLFAPEEDFRFLPLDWYQIPKELGNKEWSEPYYDGGGGTVLMTSCSLPFYEEGGDQRHFRGIVVADVSLSWLTEIVASIRVLETGYSVLISRNGAILTHPDKEMIMNETIFTVAEAQNNPSLRDIGRKMVRGESGFTPHIGTNGVKSWMYYAPVASTNWTLAVVFPEAELFAEVRSLTIKIALMGVAGILLLAMAVAFIARSITAPLHALASATQAVAAGDFDAPLPPVRSQDEVGKLTQAFSAMNSALKEYIRNLTETTAAKERIQSELKVATDIQASLLPQIFPAFPDRPEFDIFASMDPAKEVGGDFFDFFFIDEDNLCFLIADVSDKGVPAALYMMVAKTLLKSEGQRLGEPDQILANVNNILAENNDSCMFATVFCAILNIKTGEVRYANAGHNPPLVLDAAGIRYLTLQPGFVLGPMEDIVYTTERLTLQSGDVLFLFTDGVTEATNSANDLYGEPQLLAALQSGPQEDLVEMIHNIRAEVTRHANGAPQSDDVTMVALKYRGS